MTTFVEIQKAEQARDVAHSDVIVDLIGSAEVNANDTIFVEKALPVSDWDSVAMSSLCCSLSYCNDEVVLDWFRALGVKW